MIPQPFAFIGSIKLKVGMYYQGGIIVYLNDANVGGGLIAYNTGYASSGLVWGPSGAYTQAAGYGNGYTNTENAYNTLSPASNTALYTVWNATFNGYSDWFLPNVAEGLYISQMVNTGFDANPLDFWNGGTIWLSQNTNFNNMYVYDRNYPGTPFAITKFRNDTTNRNSIACRYIT